MNCEEIKLYLHDYFDGLLNDKEKEEIENHLKSCNTCFAEYKRFKKFFNLLNSVQYAVEPPKEIISMLSEELLKKAAIDIVDDNSQSQIDIRKLKQGETKKKKIFKDIQKETKKRFFSKPALTTKISSPVLSKVGLNPQKIILTLLPLVLIAVGYFVYDFMLINSPWKVRSITGKVLINGQVNVSERWDESESLVTDNFSKAIINVPNTARIEVGANSFLILQKAKDKKNRIKLIRGDIKIINSILMPYLFIEVGNSVVIDRGGTFAISYGDDSITKIIVEYGYVEIEHGGRKYFLDKKYVCEIRPNSHPGTPYRIDASEELKNEIKKFDYENGGDDSVEKIISLATDSDMLTLLAMIERVSESYRSVLFNKIASYYPPPSGVTLEGIVNLDKDMLEQWWFEIEWQI